MSYYNPITTIASVGVQSTPIPVTIVSNTAPTTRVNGANLIQGDTWWDPVNTDEYLYIGSTGAGNWNLVGVGAMTPATAAQLGSVIIGAGINVTDGGTISVSYAPALNPGATLWGRYFNGTANVSGNIDSVGVITGVGNLVLKSGPTGALFFRCDSTTNQYMFNNSDASAQGNLKFELLTSNHTYNFPDVTGTVALTSDLPPALTAGTYTNSDITVNSSGQISVIASGAGGSSSAVSDTGVLTGNLVPANDNTQFLGSDTKYFKQVFTNGLVQKDTANSDKVVMTFRNNAIILTDTTQEITTSVDLGGTIPDPGSLQNVYLDGSGRYAVGVNSAANGNGLVTQEFINSPGQFFVINDIDGGVFGPSDRQCFGLIRETLYDATDLDGGPALWAGSNSGAWSLSPFWYYTGGYPYVWTSYAVAGQTPGGLGNAATGTFGSQGNQKKWWGLCEKAQVGKRIRIGIADGTNSDPTGTNYTNRLIMQLYVSAEMLAHSDASADLPSAVISGGVGYYTSWATTGEYENMGSFADGVDKGYRFRWSTFGRTALSQLPYVTGVSTNDQIAAATGLSYYVVYDPTIADMNAANVVLATGTTSANNVFYPNVTVKILQFNQPYTSFTTPAARIYELKYTEAGAIQQSPIFHTYPIDTEENIIQSSQDAVGVQKLRRDVCNEILDAVTGYYLIRDLSSSDRTTASAFWADIMNVALAGQLQNVYDLTLAKTATALAPQELLDAVTNTAKKWINTFPVAGSGNTLNFF
jgi:hypothetical protein